jgi:beta-glucuronidase
MPAPQGFRTPMGKARRLLVGGLAAAVAGLALPASSLAGEPACAPQPRVLYQDGHEGRLLLTGGWLRRLDPSNEGIRRRWQDQEDARGWSPTQVPDSWNATSLTAASQEGGVAWYRCDFRLPDAPEGTGWRIRFESVNLRALVYVNGTLVAGHTGAALPFEAPGGRLRTGQVNRLVVRVDNRWGPADVPPIDRQPDGRAGGGWWNDGGILREVYLRRVGRVDVRGVAMRTWPDGRVRATISLAGTTGSELTLTPQASVGGVRLPFRQVALPASGAPRQLTAEARIPNPKRWSPKSPNLYPAVIADGGEPLYRLQVGLRRWQVRGGRIYLNGHRIRLYGASMHEDEPGAGFAISPERRQQDVGALGLLGANLTRAHYPLHPGTLELLDRRGIALWAQVPVYRFANAALQRGTVRRRSLHYLTEALRAERNHASLMAFSVGNELPSDPRSGARRYVRAAAALVRGLAPDAIRVLDVKASQPSGAARLLYSRSLQALGFTDYFGWYYGRSADLGPFLDRMRRLYPRLALFVSEFGAEANRPGPAGQKGTYDFQSRFMLSHLRQTARRRFMSGAVAWLLRDFRVRPGWSGGSPTPDPPYNHKGLIGYRGDYKPAFRTFRLAIATARKLGG